MERKIIITEDGSNSISIPSINVTYHSIHGAIRESKHVFIDAGLHNIAGTHKDLTRVFEMGFGTGLNALLTLIGMQKWNRKCYYETIELFPLEYKEVKSLNYCKQLARGDVQTLFERLHSCEWEKEITITPNFSFKKSKTNLLTFETSKPFHLIYFDAFDPNAQPELWTKEIFEKMFSILNPGGILVTYSSKGIVRRALQAAGFSVEKLSGPPGKREIIRAIR